MLAVQGEVCEEATARCSKLTEKVVVIQLKQTLFFYKAVINAIVASHTDDVSCIFKILIEVDVCHQGGHGFQPEGA